MKISSTSFQPLKNVASQATKKVSRAIGTVMEKGVGRMSDTKISDSLIKSLSRSKEPAVLLSHLASFAVTFFYMQNTRKSQKIPEERKPSLIINTFALTAVSSAIVPLVDAFTGNLTYELDKAYREVKPGLSEAHYLERLAKIKKTKSLTIFTGVVRFLVPVLMVPVTGTIVKKFKEWSQKNVQKEKPVLAEDPSHIRLSNKMYNINGFKPSNFVV